MLQDCDLCRGKNGAEWKNSLASSSRSAMGHLSEMMCDEWGGVGPLGLCNISDEVSKVNIEKLLGR